VVGLGDAIIVEPRGCAYELTEAPCLTPEIARSSECYPAMYFPEEFLETSDLTLLLLEALGSNERIRKYSGNSEYHGFLQTNSLKADVGKISHFIFLFASNSTPRLMHLSQFFLQRLIICSTIKFTLSTTN
jgi:hypothetical protein